MSWDTRILKELAHSKISTEFIECEKLHSFSRLYFKIVSSTRISNNRLSKIASCLKEEIGFLPKITRQDDMLYVEIRNEEPSYIGIASVQDKLTDRLSLPIPIGNDGLNDVIADLSAMPHLLVGGLDGYGKTTFLRNAINSISGTGSSKLVLIDNKDDDFKDYSNLDCLACPIIHDFDILVEKLEWLIDELEWRYHLLANASRRNIVEYNHTAIEKMPYLVLVIADYSAHDSPLRSDLILNFFSKMCAKSKAAGIHIIISSGIVPEAYIPRLLYYFPARLVFRTDDPIQSRIIIGNKDATYLYYPGEAYFRLESSTEAVRLQSYEA